MNRSSTIIHRLTRLYTTRRLVQQVSQGCRQNIARYVEQSVVAQCNSALTLILESRVRANSPRFELSKCTCTLENSSHFHAGVENLGCAILKYNRIEDSIAICVLYFRISLKFTEKNSEKKIKPEKSKGNALFFYPA